MDKNTEVILETVPGGGYGPYYNACEGRTFTTGGHTFHIFLYGGYNDRGLIGTECNGIGMVSVDDKQVVFDSWFCKGMGFDYQDAKLAELLHIIAMDARELDEFLAEMNNHGRHCRYNPLQDARLRKPRAAKAKKLDAGIAKKGEKYTDVQFMTAAEKAGVARDFELFVVARLMMDHSQLQETDYGSLFKPFTKRLYDHHSLHLGFIAHFNRSGFFGAQYEQTEDFLRNIQTFARGEGHMGYSFLYTDYGDLNAVIQKVAQHYLPAVEALALSEQQKEHASRVEAAKRLLEAEGMKVA